MGQRACRLGPSALWVQPSWEGKPLQNGPAVRAVCGVPLHTGLLLTPDLSVCSANHARFSLLNNNKIIIKWFGGLYLVTSLSDSILVPYSTELDSW